MNQIFNIIITSILLFLLDVMWFSQSKLPANLASIQGSPINMKYSIMPFIYILIAMGIVFFVIPRINDANSLSDSIIWGGLLGLIIYGVYDLTNYVIFDKYDFVLALQDVLYGFIAISIVTYIIYHLDQSFYLI